MFAPIRPTPTKPMFIGFEFRMSNVECRKNSKIRMTNYAAKIYFGFRASLLFRHSSFVLCHSFACLKPQTSNFVDKEWIVLFLFTDRRHRPVARTNNRVIRQSEDFLEIVLDGIFVGNAAPSH